MQTKVANPEALRKVHCMGMDISLLVGKLKELCATDKPGCHQGNSRIKIGVTT
jgi:hypothetical protein